jgi:hypothetical protein
VIENKTYSGYIFWVHKFHIAGASKQKLMYNGSLSQLRQRNQQTLKGTEKPQLHHPSLQLREMPP